MKISTFYSVILTAMLVGCSDRLDPQFDSGAQDAMQDSGTDSGLDASLSDAELDACDCGTIEDSGADAERDAGADSGEDACPDTGDAGETEDSGDAGQFFDSGHDGGPDTGIDGAFKDGSYDGGGGDVSFDGGRDAGDAGPVPDGAVTIDLWPWGAEGAVSFTIDEGVAEPYTILMPEIEKYGWRATFFVYTEQPYWPEVGCPPFDGGVPIGPETWPLIKDAYIRGHEIANHTNTHPDMTKKTDAENKKELEDSIAELKKNVDSTMTFFSFAYPYEESNAAVWDVVKQYHRYARGGDHGVPVPPNPVPLNPAVNPDWSFLTAKAPTTDISVEKWNSWVDAAVTQKKWFIEELHGVRSGSSCGGWEARTIEDFRAHFDHITAYGSRIYVAPFGEVGRFIEERSSVRWTVQKWSQDEIRIIFSDDFQDRRADFTVPITWVLEVPVSWGWTGVTVSQEGKIWPSKKTGGNTFRSACVPDSTQVVVVTPD